MPRGAAVSVLDREDHLPGEQKKRPNRDRDPVDLRRPDEVRLEGRNDSFADDEEGFLEGSGRGAAVVHQGQHRRQRVGGEGRPHLGRERQPTVSGRTRLPGQGGRRPRSRLRLPVEALWSGIQGHERGLFGGRSGSAQRGHRENQNEPGRQKAHSQCLERVRHQENGSAAVPRHVPILCFGRRAELLHVPEVGRHGSGSPLQRRQLLPADPHGRPRHGTQDRGLRLQLGGRSRLREPRRAPDGTAEKDAQVVPEVEPQEGRGLHRRLQVRRLRAGRIRSPQDHKDGDGGVVTGKYLWGPGWRPEILVAKLVFLN